MIDSLFDKKTAKTFATIARKKAELHKREVEAAKKFMCDTSSDTIIEILDLVEKKGHPDEVSLSKELRNKYQGDRGLEFDDIMSLDMLYKSNYKYCNDNKGDQNE